MEGDPMADSGRPMCPRCGKPIAGGVCPSCLLWAMKEIELEDKEGGQRKDPPVSPSSPERARRKLTLASAFSAIGAILSGNRWGQQPGDAVAHNIRGNSLLAQGNLKEAIAEYRKAIRLKPNHDEAHVNLGLALV